MTKTYRCPRCGRHEGRKNRKGEGFCDYCHQTFSATEATLSDKDNK